jgi:hypothetical protein
METNNSIKENKPLFTAALILLIYGIAEMGDCIYAFLITLHIVSAPGFVLTFAFPAMQEIWTHQPMFMLFIFLVFTSLRISSALGILRNRLWGWWLALISSILTLGVMPLFLPFGALDGIIAVPLLILLLVGYFGHKAIIE